MFFRMEGSTYSTCGSRVWPRVALCMTTSHTVLGGGPEKSFSLLFFIHLHTAHISTALRLSPFSLCLGEVHIIVHAYGQERVLME